MYFLELGFFINGTLLRNNSLIHLNTIGHDDYGLFCVTNLLACCSPSFSPQVKGNWWFPSKNMVPSFSGSTSLFQTRHSSSITLHHNHHTPGAQVGVFVCSIPDSMEITQNFSIHIAEGEKDNELLKIEFDLLHSLN